MSSSSSSIPSSQTDELAFVQAQVSKLSSLPVQFDDDFVSPEGNKPRKAHLVDIAVTPLPEKKKEIQEGQGSSSSGGGPSSDTISLQIKSLKPPLTFSLPSVSLSDTIASLKDLLLNTYPSTAPPPSHQRLLLKGKALADTKLLKEYIFLPAAAGEPVTLNLMVKAGWVQPSNDAPPAPPTIDTTTTAPPPPANSPSTPETQPTTSSSSRPLTPIPTLTLTPSPDLTSFHPTSTSPSHSPHPTLANPQFWVELLAFLKAQYAKEEEAEQAWETILRSQKSAMSPGEVAMARDGTGIFGMGGQ